MKIRHLFPHIVLLFFFILFDKKSIFAQEGIKTPSYFSIDYRTGENKPHREVIKNLTYPYRGADLKLGWQTTGKKLWEVAYRYPSFGAGVNWATFKTDVLGTPYAFYFFANFPQVNTKWASLELNVELGLSHGIHPYDSITNPGNFSTGTAFNAYFGFYLEQLIHLGNHVDIFAGEGFTHYSNGALGYPNLGLNIPSLKFGIRYQPVYHKKLNTGLKPVFDKNWKLITYLGTGSRKWDDPTITYWEFVFSPAVYYRTGFKRRIGLGFEIAYNEAKKMAYKHENDKGEDLMTYAVFAAHEFLIDRFSILTQLGFYLYNMPSDKIYYERVGTGFYLTPLTRIVLNLKAHYFKAEYVEAGLVFDLNFKS